MAVVCLGDKSDCHCLVVQGNFEGEFLRASILSDGLYDLAHQRGFSLDIVSLDLGPIATGVTSTPILFCIVFSFAFVVGAVLVALRAGLVILIHRSTLVFPTTTLGTF